MMFADIKVGDEVVIDRKIIAKVERITKTQFTANGRRFLRNSGFEHGGDYWHPKLAQPATPETLKEAERKIKMTRICNKANYLLNELAEHLQLIHGDIHGERIAHVAASIPHLWAALAAMRGDSTATPATSPEEAK